MVHRRGHCLCILSDELLSFLPLSHIAERMFSVFLPIRFGYTVNFTESPDTVMDNFREVSPTVIFAVPRIWEKYYSGIRIRIANATWFKRIAYGLAETVTSRYGRCQIRAQELFPHGCG